MQCSFNKLRVTTSFIFKFITTESVILLNTIFSMKYVIIYYLNKSYRQDAETVLDNHLVSTI